MYSFIHRRPQIFIDFHSVFVAAVVCHVGISVCLLSLLFLGLSPDFPVFSGMRVIRKYISQWLYPLTVGNRRHRALF